MTESRETGMNELLNLVIDTRLTEKQRTAVRLRWFEEKSLTETAEEMGISPSAASKTLAKALDEIRRRLEMTVIYLRHINGEAAVAREIDRALTVNKALRRGKSICERIRRLLGSCGFGAEDASEKLGLETGRIERICAGTALPDADEILKICNYFGLTTDSLLKGVTNGG